MNLLYFLTRRRRLSSSRASSSSSVLRESRLSTMPSTLACRSVASVVDFTSVLSLHARTTLILKPFSSMP